MLEVKHELIGLNGTIDEIRANEIEMFEDRSFTRRLQKYAFSQNMRLSNLDSLFNYNGQKNLIMHISFWHKYGDYFDKVNKRGSKSPREFLLKLEKTERYLMMKRKTLKMKLNKLEKFENRIGSAWGKVMMKNRTILLSYRTCHFPKEED